MYDPLQKFPPIPSFPLFLLRCVCCHSNGADPVSGHLPQDHGGAADTAYLRRDVHTQDQPHMSMAGGGHQLLCYTDSTVTPLRERYEAPPTCTCRIHIFYLWLTVDTCLALLYYCSPSVVYFIPYLIFPM